MKPLDPAYTEIAIKVLKRAKALLPQAESFRTSLVEGKRIDAFNSTGEPVPFNHPGEKSYSLGGALKTAMNEYGMKPGVPDQRKTAIFFYVDEGAAELTGVTTDKHNVIYQLGTVQDAENLLRHLVESLGGTWDEDPAVISAPPPAEAPQAAPATEPAQEQLTLEALAARVTALEKIVAELREGSKVTP